MKNYEIFLRGQLVINEHGYKRKDLYIFIDYDKKFVNLIDMWGYKITEELDYFEETYIPVKLDFIFHRESIEEIIKEEIYYLENFQKGKKVELLLKLKNELERRKN